MQDLSATLNPYGWPLSWPVAMIMATVVSGALVPWIRRRAKVWGAIDQPTRARKIHTAATPRLGGLAIAGGFYAGILLVLLLNTSIARAFTSDIGQPIALGLGSLSMLALGVYDDRFGASARLKLAVQVPAALLLSVFGFHFTEVALPWGGVLDVGLWGIPISMLWIVGITNAINLIDGLDGLAAGVALFAVGTTFVIAVSNGNLVMALITVSLVGALVGFLFHNFHPATIFMGDTGSLFIGYLVAGTSVMTNMKSSATVALAVPMVLLGLPLLDTSFAFSRRLLGGKSPFHADNDHVHHRLLSMGLSHRMAVLVLWGFCFLGGAATLSIAHGGSHTLYILAAYAVVAVMLARRLGYLRPERWRSHYREGRAGRTEVQGRRNVAKRVAAAIRNAPDVEEAFKLLGDVHALHHYAQMRLELLTETDRPPLCWSNPQGDAPGTEVFFDLAASGNVLARVRYLYDDGHPQLDVEEEWLMNLIHGALKTQLTRPRPLADESSRNPV